MPPRAESPPFDFPQPRSVIVENLADDGLTGRQASDRRQAPRAATFLSLTRVIVAVASE